LKIKKGGKTEMKIGYLAPAGSFSEEATLSRFSDVAPYSSFELVDVLARGEIEAAVLPVENSIEGPVNWVLDLLSRNHMPFSISAEIVWTVKQNLIGLGRISDIQTVYSIPQALGQCRGFLDKIGVETRDTDSTSAAVRLVAERKDQKIAAIGSKRAAEIYGLPIITEDISDARNNKTRFIVLGKERAGTTGRDKTSLIFGFTMEEANRSGALSNVMVIFAALDISMTMVVSRPTGDALGNYIFFVDIEGHRQDGKVRVALEAIAAKTSFLRVLGSYPKAKE